MARPPSAQAHDNVLDAALKLFAEAGIDATSMDAIAQTSGVSKATIYKHWPDKDALCLEVMARAHGAPAPLADTGDLRSDLVAILAHQPADRPSDPAVRMMPYLVAYAARNPAFGKQWQARVLDPPRLQLTRVLQRAVARHELGAAIDVDAAIALLLGPMMYGHLLRRIGKQAPGRLPEIVVDSFLRANGVTDRARTVSGTTRACRRRPARPDRRRQR